MDSYKDKVIVIFSLSFGFCVLNLGFEVLEELEEAMNKKQGNAKINELTSKFYTVIPHSFGRAVPPPIRTAEELQKKYDMLAVHTYFFLSHNYSDLSAIAMSVLILLESQRNYVIYLRVNFFYSLIHHIIKLYDRHDLENRSKY